MIRALIFDCFGVLTIDDWKEFISTLPPKQVEPVSELNRAHDAGFISEATFIEAIRDLTGRNPREARQAGITSLSKNVHLLRYIAKQRPIYRIGLLSNVGSNWIRESFLTPEEQALFDAFIFSYEVGLTKPDARMFELAADKLGVSPEECVFVDDIERNCTAARELGMKAVVYKDFRQMKLEVERLLADAKN